MANTEGAGPGQADSGPVPRVSVVLLAAGYGTRLARDMRNDYAFGSLLSTPKPLLPVGGRLVVDHWLEAVSVIPGISEVIVVTNGAYQDLYAAWAAKTEPSYASIGLRVLSDGSTTNENRLGAVTDMRIGVDALASSAVGPPDLAIFIAGDTLLPGVDLREQISRFSATGSEIGVFAYELADPTDCVRRGMLRVSVSGVVTAVVEKPSSVAKSPSNLANVPVYVLRRGAWDTVRQFLTASEAAGVPVEQRDAPGFWLSWAVSQCRCSILLVPGRIDIGHLQAYKDALVRYSGHGYPKRLAHEPAVGRALPRIGLLGNPSDGYRGMCLAAAIESEGYAEVVATPAEYFAVIRNPAHEMPAKYESLTTCAKYISDHGIHYGASQLVLAGLSAFVDAHMQQRWTAPDSSTAEGAFPLMTNCHLTYSTTIPNRVGLSGSSALILATIRALARFHKTSMEIMDADIAAWPWKLLKAETELLGITAGLMDRVAQVYEGCTFMDLANQYPKVIRLSPSRLPRMWVAYSKGEKGGSDSGKIHSTLRERYKADEKTVLAEMAQLADLAVQGRSALESGEVHDISVFPSLFKQNWKLRMLLMGRAAMGNENIRLVECAKKAGLAAKQTGSGGAVVCVPNPLRELTEQEIASMRRDFEEEGFVLRDVVFAKPRPWTEQ